MDTKLINRLKRNVSLLTVGNPKIVKAADIFKDHAYYDETPDDMDHDIFGDNG